MYQNGKLAKKLSMLGYDEYLPGGLFNITFGGRLDGHISDFNIFSRVLEEKEQEQWTACDSFEKGDILSWNKKSIINLIINNIDDNPKSFVEITTVDTSNLCLEKTNKPYIIEQFFFGSISNFDADLICEHLNGNLLTLPQTEHEMMLLKESMFDYQKNANITFGIWPGAGGPWLSGVIQRNLTNRIKDFYPTSGYNFFDRKTGKNLKLDSKVYNAMIKDPHSYSYLPELCACATNSTSTFLFTQQMCTRKLELHTACKFKKPPVMKLSGLCKTSPMDFLYDLGLPTPDPDLEKVDHEKQKRRRFTGPTGWQMIYSTEKETWMIVNPRLPDMNLTLISTGEIHIPTGKHEWSIANNTCNNGVTNVEKLLLSACDSNQFTCDEGSCISMLRRCDNFQDCQDVSDEKNCMLVFKDSEKYLKDKTPPAGNGAKKLPVELSIDVKEIISIDEVEQIINIQFQLALSWFDGRLQYYNLKEDKIMNTLTFAELDEIWVPLILFSNTQHQLISKKDQKSFALVSKNGSGTMSGQEINENIEIYEGSENPLTFVRAYAIDFRCNYDMRWYPFDIQTCSMDLQLSGILASFVEIFPGVFNYLGAQELTQYIIKDSIMVREIWSGKPGVKVSITLGRLLLGTILTTYIPTIILIIISHNASFFKPFFFESAISVNVTTMLVLTTLFLSVSGSLPTTSYIKMVDVWFIFNLMIPFFEVILHTYIDNLRQQEDEEREINHHGKKIKVGEKAPIQVKPYDSQLVSHNELTQDAALKKFYKESKATQYKLARALRIAHVWIPVCVVVFTAVYWIIGLSHAGIL